MSVLTAEEWAQEDVGVGQNVDEPPLCAYRDAGRVFIGVRDMYEVTRPDALAALCLHGQPFGFTHQDVELLRSQADWYEEQTKDVVTACPLEYLPSFRLRSLADRIAALLPPDSAVPREET